MIFKVEFYKGSLKYIFFLHYSSDDDIFSALW